ncbi:MAG TPA: N-acetyltransferase [Croceibacterium sp.]
MKGITIRGQEWAEHKRIARVITRAFKGHPHSDGREAEIFLRLFNDLETQASFVAVTRLRRIVGHVVFSEIRIGGEYCNWCGLGPLSVLPRMQGRGIGSALVEEGLAYLRSDGWNGCVVLGNPAFYGRFGFRHDPRLVYPGPPPEYFQRIVFKGAEPVGEVSYAPVFG